MAAVLVFAMLMLGMTGHATCTWCVCKETSDVALQKTLDYACGAGADCGPIHQNGACFLPNTVRAHCSYAVNSFFQRKGQAQGTCDFAGTAITSLTDPSSGACSYPATLSAAGTSTTPVTNTPSTATPSTATPSTTSPTTTSPTTTTTTTSPYTATPSNGVLGGINSGVGPSGVGTNTDYSHGGLKILNTSLSSFFSTLLATVLSIPLWG